MYVVVGGGDVNMQLCLRDKTIDRLKQEIASLKKEKDSTSFMLEERIKDLKSENELLRSQVSLAPIKKEGTT